MVHHEVYLEGYKLGFGIDKLTVLELVIPILLFSFDQSDFSPIEFSSVITHHLKTFIMFKPQ